MASPAKLSRNQQRLDACYFTNLEQLSVWLLFFPSDVCKAPETTLVELFFSNFRTWRLATMTHRTHDSGPYRSAVKVTAFV